MCFSMQNFVEIGRTVAEILQFIHFSYGGRLPFWICGANFGTTHNENLVVFMSVQNLVAIALVALIIQKFEYFVRLA